MTDAVPDGRLNPPNPLLDAHRANGDRATIGDVDTVRRQFGFAIPTDTALQAIAYFSPGGVIEIGAGLGYWAHLLHERGTDIIACDRHPPPSSNSTWFADAEPFFDIGEAGGAAPCRRCDHVAR